LIGIPLRITIGGKGLKEGIIEMKWRHQKEVVKVSLAEAESRIAAGVSDAAAKA
jgi:prolyl-tRNA synthetase